MPVSIFITLSALFFYAIQFVGSSDEIPQQIIPEKVVVEKIVEKKVIVEKIVEKKPELTSLDKRQIECLIDNIFFEAGHEPYNGKLAVAIVTMNRVHHEKFPDSVCGVIKERKGNTCQFSWKCIQKTAEKTALNVLTENNEELYNHIKDIAVYVYTRYGSIPDPTHGAIFYHADYVKPGWKNVKFTIKIGKHIFYTRS